MGSQFTVSLHTAQNAGGDLITTDKIDPKKQVKICEMAGGGSGFAMPAAVITEYCPLEDKRPDKKPAN